MGILLISMGIALVVGLGAGLVAGPIAGVLPALVTSIGLYFFLSRKVGRQLETAMLSVQKELQNRRVDNAITQLEALKKRFGRMQFFAAGSIDGQIGSIHFMQGKLDKAKPHLENGFVRMWEPQGMLAVIHAKKKDYDAVDKVLERAAKYSPKQGLLWSLWAFIHWKGGNKDKAISILARGKDALDSKDELMNSNLLALQNNKKMKMKGYGEPWYAFQLEQHPMLKQAQRGGARFARR
jgi:tetratricopeptide (TPR) repeat protein